MQSDLWQRRLGWTSLVAIILTAGALAQVQHANADETKPEPQATADPSPAAEAPIAAPVAPPVYSGLPPAALEAMKRAQEANAAAVNQMQAQQAQFQQHVQALQAENLQRIQEAQQMQAEQIRGVFNKSLPLKLSETGKFWLGVDCKEATPELRAQLALEDGQGLVVVRVAPEGPADKAGLKQHDVIVSTDDYKMAHVFDLSTIANNSNGKAIELKIIRGGKEQTVAITPAERAGMVGNEQVQIIARPGMGMVMPGNMQMKMHLPDNLEISMDRKGNAPATFSIKRGEEKWEVTSDDLSKLPDDVRPFVQQMLSGLPATIKLQNLNLNGAGQPLQLDGKALNFPGVFIQQMPGAPGQSAVTPLPGAGIIAAGSGTLLPQAGQPAQAPANIVQQLDLLQRQLEKTQQELQRLREAIPAAAPSATEDRPQGEKE